jgi:UDP-N-acetyl-D-mannosaminuronate dehydrogenase
MCMEIVGIVGYGEVGSSLDVIYKKSNFTSYVIDTFKQINTFPSKVDVLNICIPYNNTFVDDVINYINTYTPKVTIIHSTVLPDTTNIIIYKLGNTKSVVYSPIRGVHPNLEQGIKTFTKFVGGEDKEAVDYVVNHLSKLDIQCEVVENSVAAELAKILCTTYYGLCIAFHNDIAKLCRQHNVKFEEVATKWNKSYNEGYTKLNMPHVVRPVLYPPRGKIGGHCVINNTKLLKKVCNSKALDYILELQ